MVNAFRRRGANGDGGAAIVEFAVLLPLLLAVVMGIIEFGWALSQQLDVRHGAREISRMVATDDFNLSEACDRMDLSSGATITLAGSTGTVGDEAVVNVTAPLATITGFFDGWLPANLTSEVRVRIEQPPTWVGGGLC
jgi:Flp pilus assembly protein TadG